MMGGRTQKGTRAMFRKMTLLVPALATLAVLAAVGPAPAQQAGKIHQIGFLHLGAFAARNSTRVLSFIQGLRDLGYVEGRNMRIEWRFAEGKRERLPALAADLVRRKVDVIVSPGSVAAAAIKATRTIPIVVPVASNYVVRGWAKSLRRPGGNVTGLSTQAAGLSGKQLQLFKETVPDLSRVAILAVMGNGGHAEIIRQTKEAAPVLGLGIVAITIHDATELTAAFDRMKAADVGGVVVLRHGLLLKSRRQVVALARDAGLPTLFGHRVEVAAGGLMAYGADTKALFRGAATYVDKILKGADPAEMPISRATKFDLTVNLKTAKALGITFPPAILLRATEVIE